MKKFLFWCISLILPILLSANSNNFTGTIVTGTNYTLGLTNNGVVYSWGYNGYGNLGTGDTSTIYTPSKLSALDGITIKSLFSTGYSSYAISTDGKVYSWGRNNYGQLGLETTANTSTPTKISALDEVEVSTLVTSGEAIYAITTSGEVYSWGDNNSYSKLGTGSTADSSTPTKLSLPSGTVISKLKFTANSSYAITSDGDIYAWGYNGYGELGLGNTTALYNPTKITALDNITVADIFVSDYSAYALTSDGDIYSWGKNSYGKLGHGNTTTKYTPTKISTLDNITVTKLVIYNNWAYALTEDGDIYSWGDNNYGQLGHGNTTDLYVPTKISDLDEVTISSLVPSQYSAYALTSDGDAYSWGYNGYGILGIGNETTTYTPTKITVLDESNVKEIINYDSSVYALTSDKKLYSWGNNSYGQLGLGNKIETHTPTKVSAFDDTSISSFIATQSSAYAFSDKGILYSWGKNSYSVLGLGNTSTEYSPTKSIFNIDTLYTKIKSLKLSINLYNESKDNRHIEILSIDSDSKVTVKKYYIDGTLVSSNSDTYSLVDYSHDEIYFEKDSKRYWLYRSGGELYFNTTTTNQLLNVAVEDDAQMLETIVSTLSDADILAPYAYRFAQINSIKGNNSNSSYTNNESLIVSGDYLYSLSSDHIINIIDISQVTKPSIISTISNQINDNSSIARSKLFIEGNFLYVTGYYYDSGYKTIVEIIDISDKSNPKTVANHNITDTSSNLNLFVEDDYLYITNYSTKELSIYTVSSDKKTIEVLGSTTLTSYIEYNKDIVKKGDYLYVPLTNSSIDIVNVSNKNLPTFINHSVSNKASLMSDDANLYLTDNYNLIQYKYNSDGTLSQENKYTFDSSNTNIQYMTIIDKNLYLVRYKTLYNFDISDGFKLVDSKTFDGNIYGLKAKDDKLILSIDSKIAIYHTKGFDSDFDGVIDFLDSYKSDATKWFTDENDDGKVDSLNPYMSYTQYLEQDILLDSSYFNLASGISDVSVGKNTFTLNLTQNDKIVTSISSDYFTITDIYGNSNGGYYWNYNSTLPFSSSSVANGYSLTANQNKVGILQYNFEGLDDKVLVESVVFMNSSSSQTADEANEKDKAKVLNATSSEVYNFVLSNNPLVTVKSDTVWFKTQLTDNYYTNITNDDSLSRYRFIINNNDLDVFSDSESKDLTITLYEQEELEFTDISSENYAYKDEYNGVYYYDKSAIYSNYSSSYYLNIDESNNKYYFEDYNNYNSETYTYEKIYIENNKFLSEGFYIEDGSKYYVSSDGIRRYVNQDYNSTQYYYYDYSSNNSTQVYIEQDIKELGSKTVSAKELIDLNFVFNKDNTYYFKIVANSNIEYLDSVTALIEDTTLYSDKVTLDESGKASIDVVIPESRAYKFVLNSQKTHTAKLYNFGSTEESNLVQTLANDKFSTNLDLGLKAYLYTIDVTGTPNDTVTYIIDKSETELEQESNDAQNRSNSYYKKTYANFKEKSDYDYFGFTLGDSWYSNGTTNFGVTITTNSIDFSDTSENSLNFILFNTSDGLSIKKIKASDFNYNSSSKEYYATVNYSQSGGVYYIGLQSSLDDYTNANYSIEISGVNSLPKTKLEKIYTTKYYEQLKGVSIALDEVQVEEESGDSGSAIILAGIGDDTSDTLYIPTQKLVADMYKKFKYRGFSDNDINFINASSDVTDETPVDETSASVTSFINAITNTAVNDGKEGPLYIYMVDHGANGAFKISSDDVDGDEQPEILYASVLNDALDEFESKTGRKVIVMIEACNSGSFIDTISGDNRVVITSSAKSELSFIDVSGNVSFTKFLSDELLSGKSIEKSYEYALSKLQKAGSIYANQNPKISGVNSELLGLSVGGSFAAAGLELTSITDYYGKTEDKTIDFSSTSSIDLYAKVNAGSVIKKVWATIIPPNYIPPSFADANFEAPDLSSYTVELVYDKDSSTYKTNFDLSSFKFNGDFEITYYVEDNEDNVLTEYVEFEASNGSEVSTNDIEGNDVGTETEEPEDTTTTTKINISNTQNWSLVALPVDTIVYNSDISSKFGLDATIWKYDSGTWKLYSSTSFTSTTTLKPISQINAGEGFWIKDSNSSMSFEGNAYKILELSKFTSASNGWSLLGTSSTITPSQIMAKDSSIEVIWKYTNGQWYAYSDNESISSLIKSNSSVQTLQSINPGEGFWILK